MKRPAMNRRMLRQGVPVCSPPWKGWEWALAVLLTASQVTAGEPHGPLTAERAGQAAAAAGFGVLEIKADIPGAVHSRFPYTALAYDDARLASLRDKYKLSDVISGARDEWTAQLMLKEWVHQAIPKGAPTVQGANHALDILDHSARGEKFWCAHYATAYAECATALGWQSRKLGIDRRHGPTDQSTHHGVSDIWSNQFRKWVLIDSMYDLHFEKNGVPLSAWEIRAEYLKNNGADVDRVVGAPSKTLKKKSAGKYQHQHLEDEPGNYFWIYYVNHCFASGWDNAAKFILPQDEANASSIWYMNDEPMKPGRPHTGYLNNLFLPTTRIEDAHWSVGVVEATVQDASRGLIRLSLESYCPNRLGYEASIDGSKWEPVQDERRMAWALKPGSNSLRVHTVSPGNVTGPDTMVFLRLAAGAASASSDGNNPNQRERLARERRGTAGEEAKGPLRVHPANPRYFTDGTGRAIFLTGSHTWDSLQDWGGPTPNFDYPAYLDLLSGQGHNFIRLWIWESTSGKTYRSNAIAPMPWARTGGGTATDGAPKFDLSRFNDAFFDRLRTRVMAARDRGIYVSIMLFQQYFDLRTHPFAVSNNVNGLSADLNSDGDGREIHTLGHPAALACQQAFVRKVIDAVNDLDNVLYEIGNEFERQTIAWQHHMINLIHSYEREKPKQHPVGMTSTGGSGTASPRITNAELFASPTDWISPHNEPGQNYATDPPASEGLKVVIADSDHLEGVLGAREAGTYRRWIWKSLLRGSQPILMDPVQNGIPGWEKESWNQPANPALPAGREAMGRARAYAAKLNLTNLAPHSDLASSRYCLANPGKEYVVFLPDGVKATMDLSAASGKFAVEWYRVEDGKSQEDDDLVGGKEIELASPWSGHDVVLRLVRK